MRLGILTISDSVPAGKRVDTSGPKIQEVLGPFFHSVDYKVCSDDVAEIVKNVKEMAQTATLLIANGGTGLMERDNTGKAFSAIAGSRLKPLERAISAAMILTCGPMSAISSPCVLKNGRQYIIALPGRTDEVAAALEGVIKPFALAHIIFGTTGPVKHSHADQMSSGSGGKE
jgi:molybdopterin adenylyltransferase